MAPTVIYKKSKLKPSPLQPGETPKTVEQIQITPDKPRSKKTDTPKDQAPKHKKPARLRYEARRRERIIQAIPEQVQAWCVDNWQGAATDSSGQFPGTALFKMARNAGVMLPKEYADYFTIQQLQPQGEKLLTDERQKALAALRLWYGASRRVKAVDISQQTGLSPLQVHALLCRFGKFKSCPKWINQEIQQNEKTNGRVNSF